jgi:hypothetical protein
LQHRFYPLIAIFFHPPLKLKSICFIFTYRKRDKKELKPQFSIILDNFNINGNAKCRFFHGFN